jgi:hypothetical protein
VPARSVKASHDTWKESDSLGFDDLLTMARLRDEAHSWIAEQQKAGSKSGKQTAEATA